MGISSSFKLQCWPEDSLGLLIYTFKDECLLHWSSSIDQTCAFISDLDTEDWQADCKVVSRQYPTILFRVIRQGETVGVLESMDFMNGTVVGHWQASIPEIDPGLVRKAIDPTTLKDRKEILDKTAQLMKADPGFRAAVLKLFSDTDETGELS